MAIALVGAGAIGTAVAAALWKGGRRDLVFCVRGSGDTWTVDLDGDEVTLRPSLVHPDDPSAAVDWVLLATKAHQTPSAAPWLTRLSRAGTVIAVLQNGVDHVERVAPIAPAATILPVVVSCSAERTAPARVVVRSPLRLTVPAQPAGVAFAALFDPSIAQIEATADFERVAWEKLCLNAIGGLSALTGRPLDLRDPDLAARARGMLREIVVVARAHGVALDESIVESIVARYAVTPAARPNSILADRLAGRPLEYETRNGVIVRLAALHGVDVPLNRAVVAQLRAVSEGVSAREPG